LRSTLRVADELIRINNTGHTPVVPGSSAGRGFIGPHDAAAALDDHIFFATGNIRWKGNLKLDR
jgi:hypothetical protein